jgi:hypothetical protein
MLPGLTLPGSLVALLRKRGVLAGAAVMVAVAGALAALLGSPDHGGSNKPPLLT